MLFDLRGRRRRAVQVTYLMLAVLMGGGLVLFGIGGDVSGGLFDAFKGDGGGDSARQAVRGADRQAGAATPGTRRTRRSLAALVRENYQLATSQQPSGTRPSPTEAQATISGRPRTTGTRYLEVWRGAGHLARSLALQLYESGGAQPARGGHAAGADPAREAERHGVATSSCLLAAQAGDKRTADLAAQKAIDLAPKDQRKQIEAADRGVQAQSQASSRAADDATTHARWLPRNTDSRRDVNFHIEDEAVDDATHVIELGGEVDLYTAPEFKERMVELIESGKKQIVVDLSKATFIDSTTLGVLVGGVKRLRPAGGSLALVCTDDNITKIFEITGLDRVFPIHGSREEALDAVKSGATD